MDNGYTFSCNYCRVKLSACIDDQDTLTLSALEQNNDKVSIDDADRPLPIVV